MLALLLLQSFPAEAGSRWLVNDDFTDGSSAGFQAGFVAGECWGSVYVPEASEYPFEITAVRMLVGGSPAQEVFTFGFYNLPGTDMGAADLLGSEGAAVSGSDAAYNDLDVATLELDLPLIDGGNVAVAGCLDEHDGYPAIARDAGGMDYGDRNWIQTGGRWYQSETFGLSGDWIMRLCITGASVTDEGCDGISGGDADADSDADTDTDADADTDVPGEFTLTQVTPTEASEGEAVDIVILGGGFASGAEARIGGIPIVGQSRVNTETISGRTPTTLPVGVHDVEVVLDDGTSAMLPGAFEVVGAPAADKGGCGCATGKMSGLSGLLLGALALFTRRRSRA